MIKGLPKERLAFYALAAAGVIVCALTELEKYSPAVAAICGGPESGCETVRASRYSSLFGISLGYWGLASYAALVALYRRNAAWAGLFAGVMAGAEFYFAYLQISVIQAICILCMIQFAIVMLLGVLLFATAFPPARRWKYRAAMLGLAAAAFAAFFVPLKVQAAGPIMGRAESITSTGNPASPYRIEFFSDYQCHYCKQNEMAERQIMKEYPEAFIVFRDYIIQSHPYSPMAVAYANSVAYYQGKEMYLKTRSEIFDNQETILDYLKVKLPSMRQDKTMEDAVNEKLRNDLARAEQLKITGTPSIALVKNGEVHRVLRGYLPYDKLKPELDEFVGRKAQ
ncbi:MAG: thioredoxin domain-containing protein [Nitrospinae bacterium]|nr:thioredoxin domain-containing protein [Nitrospinota bacterium]